MRFAFSFVCISMCVMRAIRVSTRDTLKEGCATSDRDWKLGLFFLFFFSSCRDKLKQGRRENPWKRGIRFQARSRSDDILFRSRCRLVNLRFFPSRERETRVRIFVISISFPLRSIFRWFEEIIANRIITRMIQSVEGSLVQRLEAPTFCFLFLSNAILCLFFFKCARPRTLVPVFYR